MGEDTFSRYYDDSDVGSTTKSTPTTTSGVTVTSDYYGDGTSSVERMADISRQMWEDYKARFVPLEDKLIESKMNFDSKGSIDEAAQLAQDAFDVSQGMTQRDLGRYGLGIAYNTSPQVKEAAEKTAALDEAAAVADAKNRTRMALEEYRWTI